MLGRKQGQKFPKDWTEDELRESKKKSGTTITEVVPVNIDIKAEHRVLNLNKAKEYLSQAKEIRLMDCGCRTDLHHCDAPLDTCIGWDSAAPWMEQFTELNPRKISVETAMEVLERSHDAGLVHMAYASDKDPVNMICSCCSCCCSVLSANVRFGLSLYAFASDTISKTDFGKCDSCDSHICVDRCQFGARETVDGLLTFSPKLCFGCGLCVTKCPVGAIELVKKSEKVHSHPNSRTEA